jgi:transcriptional regulator of heat shock response
MTQSLTARQTQILKILIDEYLSVAEPVGSNALEAKHNLGISPATIRKEMNELTKMGYLRQPHTSAGRIPTPAAMKFYISQLMEEEQMSLVDEVKTKEEVKAAKKDFSRLMQEATRALGQTTSSLAIAATDEGGVWRWGYHRVFDRPEFSLEVCQQVFSIIEEETKRLHELLFERITGGSPIEVLFGEELGWPSFEPVGVVATRFHYNGHEGSIGVVGPFGLNYPFIIPTVRYFGNLIQEVLEK